MPFKDYSNTATANTELEGAIFIGPNMARNDVRPALQQLAADGRELYDTIIAMGANGTLPQFIQSGTGAVVRTAQAKLRDIVNVLDFGAAGDGTTDDTTAIRNAIASTTASGVRAIELGNLTYKVMKQITIPPNFTIHSNGAILDGSISFDVSDGLNVLYAGSDERTALPALAGDETIGDTLVSFVSAHGLAAGDVFCIYNPTDYSFSSARAYYREGEFCEVAEVTSSVQVRLTSGLRTNHTAAVVDCYKMTTGSFTIVGDLTVKAMQPAPTDATVAVFLQQIANCQIAGLRAFAAGGAYAAIIANRCYKVQLDYNATQNGTSVAGDAYGLITTNCQQIITRGFSQSTNHAIAHGGYGEHCDIPNRDIQNFGTWETTGENGIFAADVHGNSDGVSFDGSILGGISLGGGGVRVRGTITAEPTTGICAYAGEMRRFNPDFTGVRFVGNNVDPGTSTRGLIDFGGDGTFEADNMESGTARFNDITIVAPNATRGLMFRKRNAEVLTGARHNIDLRGAAIEVNQATGLAIFVEKLGVGPKDWRRVDMTGADIIAATAHTITDTTTVVNP